MSRWSEEPLVFECGGDRLVGILHRTSKPDPKLGVLVVVGGPQYRVGSHRQFVLMSRQLASTGYPVLRFDYRGMGDADGAVRSFERVEADITAAVRAFRLGCGTDLDGVVLFGVCDAASAALIYVAGRHKAEVQGLALANPWVRSETGEARSYVRHYYGRRLLQRSFWKKLLSGEVRVWSSMVSLLQKLVKSRGTATAGRDFVTLMHQGLEHFSRPVVFFLSGRDLTAREFEDLVGQDAAWRSLYTRNHLSEIRLERADHTWSSREDLSNAAAALIRWLESLHARGS